MERPTPNGAPRWKTAYVAGFIVLAGLLAVTWAARTWHVMQVREAVDARREAVAREALAYAHASFAGIKEDLLERARALARDPVVVRNLRRGAQGQAREALVEYVAALDVPERVAVEVYDPTPRLVAWQGYGMPIDEAPNTARFLQAPQVTVVAEEGLQYALAAWWPVRSGGRTVGAVRVMRTVQFRTPVQNQYLRDYSLSEQWTQATGVPVHVSWGAANEPTPPEMLSRALKGVHGDVLGTLRVQLPAGEEVIRRLRARYGDLMACWATLLLFWVAAGLWTWYRRAGRAAPEPNVHSRLRRAAGRFAVVAAAWVGIRYGLLALDVPARWQEGKAPLAPLFDPTHLATPLGGGLMRSTGDLLITAGFAFVLAVVFLRLALRFRDRGADLFRLHAPARRHALGGDSIPRAWRDWLRARGTPGAAPSMLRFYAVPLVAVVLGKVLVLGLAAVVDRVVLDSTLDYFARTGILPEPLVLVVFCALLLFAAAVVIVAAGGVWVAGWLLMHYWPGGRRRDVLLAGLLVEVVAGTVLSYVLMHGAAVVPWPAALAFFIVASGVAALGYVRRTHEFELLTLRRLLPLILLLTVLLYPLIYQSTATLRRARIVDAAASFGEGYDPRVVFSVEQVLQEAQEAPAVKVALRDARRPADAEPDALAGLDSLASELLRGSLLTSLGGYRVSLAFFGPEGAPVGRYTAMGLGVSEVSDRAREATPFDLLLDMYAERPNTGVMVERMTSRRPGARFQYAGLVPLVDSTRAAEEGERPRRVGWVVVHAEPQQLLEAGTPFPHMLLPEGYYGDRYVYLSLAEFRDGVLVRSMGRDFGRYRLPEAVQRALLRQASVWRTEEVESRTYLTLYRRRTAQPGTVPPSQMVQPSFTSVTAVRVPAIIPFDHLYYLLRLAVAGLCIGLPLYLGGLFWRWRRGELPARHVRFRDKMQDAFLIVGILSVSAVGLAGLQVLTGENRRATERWLREHLEQVEEILALEAEGTIPTYRVVDRIGIDSLAARVGLDLNLYEGAHLVASSRPRLVQERLINERMPAKAYEAIYFDGYRFTTTQEETGDFSYTAGYRALADEQGRPRYVISAPTLPEQERIEEEQARTVAYLFGALLLLIVAVMLTASLLARALARPIARLRSGLEAVGKGDFARKLPVDTRDEIGELVATFNAMREQLAESRRKLAQQERELAWREMARQVAHEIKNPLTPMKLSVQHLRRAFQRRQLSEQPATPRGDGASSEADFASLFERITSTLIDQIDTLAHIANEFSTFARLPTRVLEPLDLNEVVEGAVALMQEETGTEIAADLHEVPLVVKADREELRRIYINLIKNALQAIPEGREGRIAVATREHVPEDAPPAGPGANGSAPTRWAESTVTDNGAGISRELRDKIFQPNFSTKNSGTGLGLAIVKKGVEEMGGEIGFETEEGRSTTFRIRLPLAD